LSFWQVLPTASASVKAAIQPEAST
jgi:hypothetical protein